MKAIQPIFCQPWFSLQSCCFRSASSMVAWCEYCLVLYLVVEIKRSDWRLVPKLNRRSEPRKTESTCRGRVFHWVEKLRNVLWRSFARAFSKSRTKWTTSSHRLWLDVHFGSRKHLSNGMNSAMVCTLHTSGKNSFKICICESVFVSSCAHFCPGYSLLTRCLISGFP